MPTAFSFNCTEPPDGVNFVRSPTVRGTTDIVWGCLGVLVLSTWDTGVHHLKSHQRTWSSWDNCKRWFSLFGRKLWDMIVAVMAPEIVTGKAIYNHIGARNLYHSGKTYATTDGVEWSIAKAYFAQIKGFHVVFDETKFLGASDNARTPSPSQNSYNMWRPESRTTDFGDTSYEPHVPLKPADEPKPHDEVMRLTGGELIYLRQIGVLETLPTLTLAELDDRNKSNSLIKVLAISQSLWLVVQVIVRAMRGLFISQLEVVTLAFATLTFFTMIIEWDRPKDVRCPTKVYATRYLTSSDISTLRGLKEDERYMTDKSNRPETSDWIGCCVGIIFGGLHCIAWNEAFPTHVERLLWRIAAVLTTTLPFLAAVFASDRLEKWRSRFDLLLVCLLGVYILGRLYIVVETIRALFFQPPGAFVTTWVANFPHLG